MAQVWEREYVVTIGKTGETETFDWDSLPAATKIYAIQYGLQQSVNDAGASAKSDDERIELCGKRADNLRAGTIRATGGRTSDPVTKRAKELAEARIKKNANFLAWLEANDLKIADKTAREKLANLVAAAIAKEGNPFIAQAKIDVEAAKALDEIEIEI